MITLKLSEPNMDAILALMAADAWGTVTVRLTSDASLIGQTTDVEDLAATEPTQSWYTAIAAVEPLDIRRSEDDDNSLEMVFPSQRFEYSGTDGSYTAQGVYITDGDGNFLGGAALPEPETLAAVLDAVDVQVKIKMPVLWS